MKHELTLYQSIRNGGDGSASAHLVESKKLAQWDQDHQSEGWGETCIETIRLVSDSPITVVDSIETKEDYLKEMLDYCQGGKEEIDEFISEFFPDGLPSDLQELVDAYEED